VLFGTEFFWFILLKEKVIVCDGAMGSNLQWQNLTIIEKVHTGFLEVGRDVIETNSFGGGEIYHGNVPDGAKEHIISINDFNFVGIF
jgi:methionine synthase I (cobalamin-dependent)